MIVIALNVAFKIIVFSALKDMDQMKEFVVNVQITIAWSAQNQVIACSVLLDQLFITQNVFSA